MVQVAYTKIKQIIRLYTNRSRRPFRSRTRRSAKTWEECLKRPRLAFQSQYTHIGHDTSTATMKTLGLAIFCVLFLHGQVWAHGIALRGTAPAPRLINVRSLVHDHHGKKAHVSHSLKIKLSTACLDLPTLANYPSTQMNSSTSPDSVPIGPASYNSSSN